MSSTVTEKWGFSSQPVHMQMPKYPLEQRQEEEYHDSDSSPYTSDVEESLCCCPSISEMLTACSHCCATYICCCCRGSEQKTDKFAKVNYSYLSPEKSVDSIDGVILHGDSKSLDYNPVFQFPQAPQQFPTHPALPFKPRQIELRQPQMKFTPGAGTGRVIIPQTDSPFPAPYLQGRGPGMQTPFSEVPIQRQPQAGFHIDRGTGSIQVATATAQRKKRSSRATGKGSRQNSLTNPTTTVTDVDVATTTTGGNGERESESKVTFDNDEEEKLKLRQSQGRQMSLPAPHMVTRGRKRIFSIAGKRAVGGFEGIEDEGKRRKHRLIHRARTVGSSPSQQPTIDPGKLRRCQTPDFSIEDTDKLKPRVGKKGLALRKCKTPDTIMMRGGSKRDGGGVGEGGTKRFSESPETEGSSSLTASPGSKSGGHPEDEREVEGEEQAGEEEEGGKEERDFRGAASASVGKVLSLDGSSRRRWGSWRERSRKDPGSPQEGPSKSAKIPTHITSSTSAYLLSSAGDTSGGAEVASTTDENPPYIYFSLYFDIQRRALMVNLIKVENLPPKPPNQGSCDPFVMLFLLPNKQEVLQSVVKQRTLNPEFQQVFEFGGILANDLKNQVLVFRVFDHDRFSKNDLMGTVIMPLKDADLYGMLMRRPVDQRKGLLKQFSAGDLLFSLTYSEERKVINGIILKATNLRKADIWGLADPYVKIYMIHESKRMNKWKTEVKKNTLVPIYNESFQFDVSGLDIRNVSLEIWVMDYDWFSRNDKMGVVYVGANSPQEVGRNHWMEIISAPEHQTSHWHTIIPYTDLKLVLPLAKQQLQQRQLQVQQEELQQQQQGQHKQQQRQHKQQQHRRQRQRGVQFLQPPPNPAQQQQLPGNDTNTSDVSAAP